MNINPECSIEKVTGYGLSCTQPEQAALDAEGCTLIGMVREEIAFEAAACRLAISRALNHTKNVGDLCGVRAKEVTEGGEDKNVVIYCSKDDCPSPNTIPAIAKQVEDQVDTLVQQVAARSTGA